MRFSDFFEDPTPTKVLERDRLAIARTEKTIARLEMELDRRKEEFRGSVSSRNLELEQLESFRDRLISENVRKQAEPEIVRKNIRRTERLLDDELKRAFKRVPNPRVKNNFWSNDTTSVVDHRRSGFYGTTPRTVFGSEAWISPSIGKKSWRLARSYKEFRSRGLVIPCIQRAVRKEVLFARGKGGKGHRVPHRPSVHGDIWC